MITICDAPSNIRSYVIKPTNTSRVPTLNVSTPEVGICEVENSYDVHAHLAHAFNEAVEDFDENTPAHCYALIRALEHEKITLGLPTPDAHTTSRNKMCDEILATTLLALEKSDEVSCAKCLKLADTLAEHPDFSEAQAMSLRSLILYVIAGTCLVAGLGAAAVLGAAWLEAGLGFAFVGLCLGIYEHFFTEQRPRISEFSDQMRELAAVFEEFPSTEPGINSKSDGSMADGEVPSSPSP